MSEQVTQSGSQLTKPMKQALSHVLNALYYRAITGLRPYSARHRTTREEEEARRRAKAPKASRTPRLSLNQLKTEYKGSVTPGGEYQKRRLDRLQKASQGERPSASKGTSLRTTAQQYSRGPILLRLVEWGFQPCRLCRRRRARFP